MKIFSKVLVLFLLTVLIFVVCGFSVMTDSEKHSLRNCLINAKRDIDAKPELSVIKTIKGKDIDLSRFKIYEQYRMFLPEKFYYWKSEIREAVSELTMKGIVKHKVRAYFNLVNKCRPDLMDVEARFGDVAEIYDEDEEFMGLVLYVGHGMYLPLPYPVPLIAIED